jgi:hypothetical protein
MAIYQQVGNAYRLYLGPVQGIDTWLWMAPGFSPLGGDTVMAGPMAEPATPPPAKEAHEVHAGPGDAAPAKIAAKPAR